MKRIFYLIIISFLTISCSIGNDDLADAEKLYLSDKAFSLLGEWKLQEVVNSFSTKKKSYKGKNITFTFQKNGKVFISKDNEAFFKGTYPYRISDEKIAPTDKNTVKMVVIDRTKFLYKYEKGVLELSNAYVDGVIIYLTK